MTGYMQEVLTIGDQETELPIKPAMSSMSLFIGADTYRGQSMSPMQAKWLSVLWMVSEAAIRRMSGSQ